MRNTDRFDHIFEYIIDKLMTSEPERKKKSKVFAKALSVFVVFIMTYMLVLPAFTLDQKSAAEQGGIDVPAAVQQEDKQTEPAESSDKEDKTTRAEKTDNESADKEDESKQDSGASQDTSDGNNESADPSTGDDQSKADGKSEENAEDAEKKDEEKDTLSELVFKGEGFTVTVSGKDAKFPADTELKVKEIVRKDDAELYDSYEKDAREAIKDEDNSKKAPEFAFARFYDITMISDGSEYEPETPVEVNITYDKDLQKDLQAEKSQNIRVVHFDDKQSKVTPEVIDSSDVDVKLDDNKMTEATFAAESFSVYALVYTVEAEEQDHQDNTVTKASKGDMEARGKTYTITVEYDYDAGIPEGAELKVREIREGTEEYEGYLADSAKEMGVKSKNVSFARFFDIEIVKGGEKIEPKAPVQVRIDYKDALEINNGDSLSVVHFADAGTEVITDTVVSDNNKEIAYEQDSFSVTGTIITNAPESGKKYAVIVKRNNHYYSVLNDGSLELIDSAYDPVNNVVNVDIKYPLLWNYTSGFSRETGNYHNLSIPSLGVDGTYYYGFAHDFYDRYFNVNNANGLVEESPGNNDLRSSSAIWYENNHLYGYSGNSRRYIGVSEDGSGIIGRVTNENDAAEIYFARLDNVEAPADNSTHDNHMVDHIDISISGETTIKLPLAYGDYYDSQGNVVFTSTSAHHIMTMTPEIDVTTDDLKKASIVATDKNTGTVLNDVFYITGYSQNQKEEGGQSVPDQVRIEGSFKVSNIPNAENADNRPEIREARRANPILYTVTVTKTVPVEVELEDGTKLYIKENGSYVPLVVEVPLSLSSSFDYWDEGNECPPLHYGYEKDLPFVQEWIDGKIKYDSMSGALTGMDFQLVAFKEDDLHVVKPALEINKTIQKENSDGTYSNLKTDATHNIDVDVYYKAKEHGDEDNLVDVGCDDAIDPAALAQLTEGFESLHPKTITVGKDAFGAAYDYDLSPDGGMFYVKEDPKSIDQYVTGKDGKTYQYVSSRIETEYVWRTDGDEEKTHFADGTTSVPEVLGAYSYEGENLYNSFLVFDVYNVYREVETVDVPVDKTWPELESDNSYTWTSTFVLEEKEVHESGPVSSEANTEVFREVEGVAPITISKGDTGDAITFKDLPKYRYYEVDGEISVYRIMYSVDETAYELKHGGTTVSKWDNVNGLTVGDEIYAPYWPHDAGDADDEMHLSPDDALFYHVIVENHKRDITVKELLRDLRINKTWEDGALEEAGVEEKDAYARFQLKRYVTTEHLSYDSRYYDGTDATVRLIGQDGNTDSLTVKKGARVNIVATFSGPGAVRYTVDGSGTECELSWYSGDSTQVSNAITVTGNNLTIRANNYSWHGGRVSEDHLQLSSAGGGSETDEDTEFTNEQHLYTLNREGGWTQFIDNLPLYAESEVKNGEQNIYHYSYYFTEVDSNPAGFYSEFTDRDGNPIGNANNRITEDDTTVNALNKPIPDLYVKKEWHDIEDPDSYPEIRFTLYQGLKNGNRVQEGSVFVGDNGESYVDIPLNSDNDWTWKCPGYLPDKNANGQDVGYYVVEKTGNDNNRRQVLIYNNSELNSDGSIKVPGEEITTSQKEKDEVWLFDYYNDQNEYTAYRNDQQMPRGWEGGFVGNTGTLNIVNRSPKYMQMDIKKKIMEYQPDGSLATTTGWPSRTRDIVLKIQLMRRVYLADAAVDAEPLVDWTNYGVPFYVGYDAQGHDIAQNTNDFDVGVGQSSWHWTILDQNQENGLPAYGYYTQDDGTVVKVHYRYIPFEVGAYRNLEEEPLSEEFDWFVGLQPAAWDGVYKEVDTFEPLIGQDQDRLMNVQASDLEVDKEWTDTPDNVEEVYVKIYRQAGSDPVEDFTQDIATRTDVLDVYGFVDDPSRLTTLDNGALVLGLTPETGGVLIHNVLMTPATENGHLDNHYYEYWIEEVGYKDKDGNVYFTNGSDSATSTFFAEYDKSDSNGAWTDNWTDTPTDNKLKLSTKGKNKLRVKNRPTKDIEVEKLWIDENGAVLDEPWNKPGTTTPVASSISFKVKRGNDYLTFNGQDKLTISTDGQRAVVRTATPDSTAYTVTYVSDDDDKAAIGNWKTLIHGLQKYSSTGDEYTYTVEEVKNSSGKPVDSDGNVIQNCHVRVIDSETGFAIRNEKIDTSLAIEKIFAGSVELTDEQKQKIQFTVTGPDGFNKKFTYGVDGELSGTDHINTDKYKWNNGILIIGDISPGDYTVTEQHDDVASIFEGDDSGTVYTHTHTFAVTAGTGTVTADDATADVEEGERTTVTVTNTYDEGPTTTEVTLKKVDASKVDTDPLQPSDLLDGAKFVLKKYTQLDPENEDTAWNAEHDDENAGQSGVFTFEDLSVGYYKIVETELPSGHIKLAEDPIFEVFVNDNGEMDIRLLEDADGMVRKADGELVIVVGNEPGEPLPSAGGPGTTLFYLFGSILLLGSVIVLAGRARSTSHK